MSAEHRKPETHGYNPVKMARYLTMDELHGLRDRLTSNKANYATDRDGYLQLSSQARSAIERIDMAISHKRCHLIEWSKF